MMCSKPIRQVNFRLQYASNLYITRHEKPLFPLFIKPAAPYLAIVGNVGNPSSEYYDSFFRWAADRWHSIIYVPGEMENSNGLNLSEKLFNYPNIFVLDRKNQFYVYDPLKLVLWTPADNKTTQQLFVFTYGCDERKTFLEHHGTIYSHGLNGVIKKTYCNSRGLDETPAKEFSTEAVMTFPIKNLA